VRRSARFACVRFACAKVACVIALAFVAAPAALAGSAGGGAAEPALLVVQTLSRRAANPEVAPPERRFAVERRDKPLNAYELRLRFAQAPQATLAGQTVTCRARLATDRLFEFAYRDQTIEAGRAESESYVFSLPDSEISTVRCVLGSWPGS